MDEPAPPPHRLTRHRCAVVVDGLVALDGEVLAERGRRYTDDVWTARSFLHDLPDKWLHSSFALSERRVLGFWLASSGPAQRVGAYTHRVALHPAVRGCGLATAMLERVKRSARAQRLEVLTLCVGTANTEALRFYAREGFRPMGGAELRAFLEIRAMSSVEIVGSETFRERISGFEKSALRLVL